MIYDFDYAIKRWEDEYGKYNEEGVLKYYYRKYKDMKPGTVERYSGYLKNSLYINDILKTVGGLLPEDFSWSEVPKDEDVCCGFEAKGDLSEYELEVYYSEKLFDGESDYEIVSYKGSLTPEQFDKICHYLSIYGYIEATIFLGFAKKASAEYFDELSFNDFICQLIRKI